ncbi:hypothetical protein PCC7424_5062 [Gloeothece citriformis PCC 7424]|uniref:Low temperature-induced protein n=1 Tax=Gloeothece citriformis (strain PCC 7424) TaxID=65393 RepID=B7KFT9_GLOC7|nr:hypothetical protein [Gloeothece citriformis]ACK73414.1 hypothetical protein PCC7424_5062 [Gloeothece citriformis PCC 7424]
MKSCKSKILRIGLSIVLLLSLLILPHQVFAAPLNPEKASQKTERAADIIVQDNQKENVKRQFGLNEHGSELVDKARDRANEKLKSLADKTRERQNTGESIPPDQKLFLEKMER